MSKSELQQLHRVTMVTMELKFRCSNFLNTIKINFSDVKVRVTTVTQSYNGYNGDQIEMLEFSEHNQLKLVRCQSQSYNSYTKLQWLQWRSNLDARIF